MIEDGCVGWDVGEDRQVWDECQSEEEKEPEEKGEFSWNKNSNSLNKTCLVMYILWVVESRQIYPLEYVG